MSALEASGTRRDQLGCAAITITSRRLCKNRPCFWLLLNVHQHCGQQWFYSGSSPPGGPGWHTASTQTRADGWSPDRRGEPQRSRRRLWMPLCRTEVIPFSCVLGINKSCMAKSMEPGTEWLWTITDHFAVALKHWKSTLFQQRKKEQLGEPQKIISQ